MLTLICGLPNAGKTTYSEQYDNVLHLDYVGLPRTCNKVASGFKDIVIEGTYTRLHDREDLLDKCAYQDYKKCIFLNTSVATCRARESRGRTDIVGAMSKDFVPPTLQEGWDEIITIYEDGRTTQDLLRQSASV